MADDDVPEDREREPAPEPKRPFTLQDARVRADQAEQEARREREQRNLIEHKTDIEHLLDIQGIHDPETRALAIGFIASNIAATGYEYEQLAPHDRHIIAEQSVGQAREEEEKRRQTPENEEVARQSGDQPDRDQRPGEIARNQTAKEEEPERQRESETGKEISDAKAARTAKIRERHQEFEKEQWDKARQETTSREPGGRERD
jgi:hypothetical protein